MSAQTPGCDSNSESRKRLTESTDTETLAEVRLTDDERDDLMSTRCGCLSDDDLFAEVERIIAARIEQARAEVNDAEMELNEAWLHRYAELHQKYLIATCPWCTCEEGPYFGAQLAGTPLRCERCGHDESVQARAGEGALRERVEALADAWQADLDAGGIRDKDARYCWQMAVSELRAALAETDQP